MSYRDEFQNYIIEKSNLLKKDLSFKNLYELIFHDSSEIACLYNEKGEKKSLTFGEYNELSTFVASYIIKILGPNKNDNYIGLALDTCPLWQAYFWGIIKAGYNVLLLNFAAPNNILSNLINESGAVAILSDKKRGLNTLELLTNDVLSSKDVIEIDSIKFADKIALCTSGTTGNSRIFVYNGAAICNQVLSSEILYNRCKRIIDNKERKSLAFLPYHHVFGFITGVLWIPFIGYKNVYIPDRAPQTILKACNEYNVNMLITVPILANNICTGLNKNIDKSSALKKGLFKFLKSLSLIIQKAFPEFGLEFAKKVLFKSVHKKLLGTGIDCIILGGSHTPKEHIKTLTALGYYTVCGFGMTETAINSVETDMSLKKRLLGSVGMPLSNIEYRVNQIGEKSNVGEMYIKGKTLHIGMLKDGKQVAAERVDGEWFPTGDIVRIEKDNRVYVEGRCKDLIINESGENVYPDEIENYFSAIEYIDQFSVIGIKKSKDSKYEDITLVVNVVEKYNNNTYVEKLQSDIIKINSNLDAIKRLNRVIITPSALPLVNGIKVKRLELKSLIENNKIAYKDLMLKKQNNIVNIVEPQITKSNNLNNLEIDEIKNKLILIYSEVLNVEQSDIKTDAHFIDDLGGDSLQILTIALKTEETFNINIPVEQYPQCATINDLASMIYGLVRGDHSYQNDNTITETITPIRCIEEDPNFIKFKERQNQLLSSEMENPYFVEHNSPLLDKSSMNNHEVINFGSYNYVGMSGRKEVNDAAISAVKKYGTSASGSRLLAGEKDIHKELEKEIAKFKHTEDAIVLVGGHSTNVTFVGNFCGKNDLILYDALAHNSIEQGCKLSKSSSKPFPHNDYKALEQILKLHRYKYEKVLIVVEGAYSMDGDIAHVPEFVKLKREYGCFLMVDEAHSACVIGEHGQGVDEYFGLNPDDIDIKMGTLSKGIGTCGGYLAGKKDLIEYLRYNLPGFVFSVGISPALAAAAKESLVQLRENPQIIKNLHNNIKFFVDEAKKRKLNICLAGETAIIPILIGSDEDSFLLSNLLLHEGVFVPPAVYPAVPKNKARLRFCVISEHKPEQITYALDKLVELAKQHGIQLPN